MKTPCPCCGSEIVSDLPVVDLNSNTFAWGGQTVKLSKTPAEIAHVLIKKSPQFVPREVLISSVWGMGEPETAQGSLSVHMTKLRRAIEPLGFSIDVIYNSGWRIAHRENVEHKGIGLPANTGRPRNG